MRRLGGGVEADLESKLEYHVKEILRLLGEDVSRPGLRETPRRFARALLELTRGLREEEPEPKFFPMEIPADVGRVEIANVRFVSLCEHHLLPIVGSVSIVYKPLNAEVPGLSKVARYVKWLAARPILQERFTAILAESLRERLRARYVYVKVCALHMCTFIRGVKDEDMVMVTEAWSGDGVDSSSMGRAVKCTLPLPKANNL